jgi:DNA-binding transcriptional MerR regulator
MIFFIQKIMQNIYPTKLVLKLSKATANQIKYWVKVGIVSPERRGKTGFYSLKDIIKLKVLSSLREKGLSLQKIRKGIKNLSEILPNEEDPLSRLLIYTDGIDMIVAEKRTFFSAITRQQYFVFDTEQITAEIITLQKAVVKRTTTLRREKEEKSYEKRVYAVK